MRVEEIHIVKFRSILKSTVVLEKINAIVGENNVGKTAILRALNAFFNYDKEELFIDKSHQYAKRSITKILVVFDEVPETLYFKRELKMEKTSSFQWTYS